MSQETQVKEQQTVRTPEVIQANATNVFVGNLEVAFKEAMEQIRRCDEQIALWTERKRQIQEKTNETLSYLQQQVNGEPEKKPVAPSPKVDKDASIPELINSFLGKRGPARSKDIRNFLLSIGRKTNPAVSLGRMVKKGDLKHTGRGTYELLK